MPRPKVEVWLPLVAVNAANALSGGDPSERWPYVLLYHHEQRIRETHASERNVQRDRQRQQKHQFLYLISLKLPGEVKVLPTRQPQIISSCLLCPDGEPHQLGYPWTEASS